MNSQQLNSRIPYATQAELDFISAITVQVPPEGQIVLIGAGPGVMLLAMREVNQQTRITVIDHETCVYAQRHLGAEGLDQNVRYIVSDSSQAGKRWGAEPIDFLIVDGDHTYEGVSRDLLAWLPCVVVGGIIFLHDYDAEGTQFENQERYPGVKLAAETYLPAERYAFLRRVGTAGTYRKLNG
jgi:predicted O-methyltransferase YrrM